MKITAIKQQLKRTDRYSVFVDSKYSFSLSEAALLEHRLVARQELSLQRVREFKKISAEDKLYNQTLRYIAMRLRSRWEIEFYLERKGASPSLTDTILSKLSNIGMIDDEKLAKVYVNDRQLLRPTSRRKMTAELRKKRIDEKIIEQAIDGQDSSDSSALQKMIQSKRRQAKYQDDLKLMQYLARQGFNYGDIKAALEKPTD